MAYERTVDKNGAIRYRKDGKLVAKDDVPEDEVTRLENEAKQGGQSDQPTPPPIDNPEDIDDQSGTEPAPGTQADEPEPEEEPELPSLVNAPPETEHGMGFKMNKEGRTLDIFSDKVHTHVRNVAGVMVPLSKESFETKSDTDILEELKKLKKV